MASRRLEDLAPPVQAAALSLVSLAAAQGFDLLVYCTLRSNAEQAALYASGRTRSGPILTAAQPGQSLHNPDENGHAWAFDAVPIVNGKCAWLDDNALHTVGVLAESVGLVWAGRWPGRLREKVHFQLAKGVSHVVCQPN